MPLELVRCRSVPAAGTCPLPELVRCQSLSAAGACACCQSWTTSAAGTRLLPERTHSRSTPAAGAQQPPEHTHRQSSHAARAGAHTPPEPVLCRSRSNAARAQPLPKPVYLLEELTQNEEKKLNSFLWRLFSTQRGRCFLKGGVMLWLCITLLLLQHLHAVYKLPTLCMQCTNC